MGLRIQTFPENWDVSGNKSTIEQIVGNAVPVKLAEFVGECLLEYVQNPCKYQVLTDRHGNCRLFEQKKRYKSSREMLVESC